MELAPPRHTSPVKPRDFPFDSVVKEPHSPPKSPLSPTSHPLSAETKHTRHSQKPFPDLEMSIDAYK
jgi:hypothetical protein